LISILALEDLVKFEEICSKKFIQLKSFHFSIYFVTEFEEIWRKNLFSLNNKWHFDNIDFYIDEMILWETEFEQQIEQIFVIYKRPIDILLRYKRSLYDQNCTSLLTTPMRNVQQRSIVWNWS